MTFLQHPVCPSGAAVDEAMTLVQLTGRIRIVEQLHCRKQSDGCTGKVIKVRAIYRLPWQRSFIDIGQVEVLCDHLYNNWMDVLYFELCRMFIKAEPIEPHIPDVCHLEQQTTHRPKIDLELVKYKTR
jgi:hypothetical protein